MRPFVFLDVWAPLHSHRDGASSTLLLLKNTWKCLYGFLSRSPVHIATAMLGFCNLSVLVRDVLSFFTTGTNRGSGLGKVPSGNLEDLSRVSFFQDSKGECD